MHKKTAITIIALLIGIIVVAVLLITRHIRIQSPIVFLNEPQQIVSDDQGRTAIKSKDSLDVVEIDTRTEREKVLDQYGDKVLAFDSECQVYPRTMSIPVRTVIVLNNRSAYERVIAIGSRNYVVEPQNYSLATNNQPGNFTIACDDHAQGKLEVVE